jgi:hypothetical protein
LRSFGTKKSSTSKTATMIKMAFMTGTIRGAGPV